MPTYRSSSDNQTMKPLLCTIPTYNGLAKDYEAKGNYQIKNGVNKKKLGIS